MSGLNNFSFDLWSYSYAVYIPIWTILYNYIVCIDYDIVIVCSCVIIDYDIATDSNFFNHNKHSHCDSLSATLIPTPLDE